MNSWKLDLNGSSSKSDVSSEKIVKTKPLYGKERFLWELESIETVMSDGVQRAIYHEFEVALDKENVTKWRLVLDVVDVEPAITVEKISPLDKSVYFRLGMQVMRNEQEESDIIGFPNTKLFYEGADKENKGKRPNELHTFSLHKQLDYGCSHNVWFKEVLNEDKLLLRVNFEVCSSITY